MMRRNVMKRNVMIALLCGTALLAVGCSGSGENETEAETGTTAETEETGLAQLPDYTALDYVTLGEYKELEVSLLSTEVTDEDILVQVIADLDEYGLMEELEDGDVQMGDLVNINYTAMQDGEEIEDGSVEDYDLVIGSGTFIEGFEEGLVGKHIEDSILLELTYPEEYESVGLAGEDIQFTVKINSIFRMPELTDEVASQISDCETYDDYIEDVRARLLAEKEENQYTTESNDILSVLKSTCTIDGYPQEVVDYYVNQAIAQVAYYADAYDYTYEDYVDAAYEMTEEEFSDYLTEYYEEYVISTDMILRAIAETEGIEVSDDEYEGNLAGYAEEFETDVYTMLQTYPESELREMALQDKVMDFLIDNAVVVSEE